MKMTGRPIRVYADASVYGGAFDEEFDVASQALFNNIRSQRLHLVISSIVRDELENAPERVFALFEEMRRFAEVTDVTEDALQLQQAYLDAGIVGRQWENDALPVALATESQCTAIVSWNFKHIVNFKKIPLYNGVNLAHGYGSIAIHTPQEMIVDED